MTQEELNALMSDIAEIKSNVALLVEPFTTGTSNTNTGTAPESEIISSTETNDISASDIKAPTPQRTVADIDANILKMTQVEIDEHLAKRKKEKAEERERAAEVRRKNEIEKNLISKNAVPITKENDVPQVGGRKL